MSGGLEGEGGGEVSPGAKMDKGQDYQEKPKGEGQRGKGHRGGGGR